MDASSVLLQQAIAGWCAALQADSANPQPQQSLDGVMVDNDTWRKELLDRIEQAQTVINKRNPTVTFSPPIYGGYGYGCYPFGYG